MITKEEMNENLKTYVWKEDKEKSERQINKRKQESCGNIVIGGNFFIISKTINWVTSQFLNEQILGPYIILGGVHFDGSNHYNVFR